VAVGCNLESLLYSYKRKIPVVFVDARPPFRFDYLEFNGVKTPQVQMWEALLFILNMSGLVLFPGILDGLKIDGNELVAKSIRNKMKIKFDNLLIFDDKGVDGLPEIKTQVKQKNRVVDWINVRSSGRHGVDSLYSDGDFVSEVIFYPSDRNDNKVHKDIVAISYLKDEQLLDFDFSSTMVKFMVLGLMKGAGIKGKRNGVDSRNPTKYKYYAIKIEPTHRTVEPFIKKTYADDSRFIFMNEAVEDILKMKGAKHPLSIEEVICRQKLI
jgi:hypothetical protein